MRTKCCGHILPFSQFRHRLDPSWFLPIISSFPSLSYNTTRHKPCFFFFKFSSQKIKPQNVFYYHSLEQGCLHIERVACYHIYTISMWRWQLKKKIHTIWFLWILNVEHSRYQKPFWSKNIKDPKMQQVVWSYSFNPRYFKIFKIISFFSFGDWNYFLRSRFCHVSEY